MRLIKLVLHKYKRMRLNLIETFTYEPTAPTQFVIGTNGSGKSSLFNECSPLPPDRHDFEDGGYKYALFDLDGVLYETKNDFTGGQHHSFKRAGIELNEGGTVTVQSDLVKRYFRYTPEIHSLVTGQLSFSRMNAADRKRWFTLLANESYDYGIGVFRRVTELYNESRHALKRSKERLVVESAKLLPADEMQQLRDECSDLYLRVQRLIEVRQPLTDPAPGLIDKSNQIALSLQSAATEVRQLLKRLSMDYPRSIQQVREAIAAENQNQISLQQQADQYFADFERMQRLWEAMQATHLENAAQIQQEITGLENTIAQSQKALQLGLSQIHNPEVAIASCDMLLAWWPSVETNLHDNREKNWGRAMFQQLQEEIGGLQTRLEQAKSLRDRAFQTIEHHELHSKEASVDCPKCNHKFQPNFSAAILEDTKRRHREMTQACETMEKELKERLELREQIQAYFNTYTSVIQQIRNSPGMEVFLEWITKDNILLHTPKRFTTALSQYREDAGLWAKIEHAQKRIQQVRELASQLTARGGDMESTGVQSERQRLENLVGECEFNKHQGHAKLQRLQQQLQTLEQLQSHQQRLSEGLAVIDQLHAKAADSLRREVFAQMLRELQSQLAFKEQALMAADRQQSVIEHITSEIEELTLSTADLKILQQELSPTEGLIAEGLFGFMRMFTEQLNQTLEMLFTYPLKIQPCANESKESVNLNYKFPLIVNGDTRSDISKGSTGMREVIDLAFVIAGMKAMGLGTYPLFLDEFGRTLDPVHKQASVALLISMMELERFEQVFLISHDIVQYSGVGRSEICVLHGANVQLPPNCSYNTNCKFE